MKKFNKLFNTETTKVKINGRWYQVREINDTRVNIKVVGLGGSFQKGHIEGFSNKRILNN